jgi:aspartate 1-decarboxylase
MVAFFAYFTLIGNHNMQASLLKLILAATFLLSSTGNAFGYDGACPALAAPTGPIVTVDSETGIWNAVNNAASGTTILIADGTYNLGQKGYYLWFDTPNVTLRSATGNREGVVLDDNYSGSEIITVAASHVTIADVTLMRAGTHPIHVISNDTGDTLNTLIYNVHIIDPGQQAIKINPHAAKVHFTDDGVIACSTIELTDSGRAKVWEINGSCYTGGVDGHQSRGWVIRDNTVKGFWCQQGLAEHGVHFWTGSRDTVVERNKFIDNARGVGFGLIENGTGRIYADNPCPGASGYVDHFGGIIRNNFISADRTELFNSEYGADGGIALTQACGAQAVHNTVAFAAEPFAAIEWRFANTDVNLLNNLATHNLMDRGGSASLSGNLSNQPLSLFVDSAHGDLHLKSTAGTAIDQGTPVPSGICNDDFDGQSRPVASARDVGADEYSSGPGNTPPIADDLSITVDRDSTGNVIFLGSYDDDGDTLSFSITTGPANGSLSGTAPNLYYTPSAGYTGHDGFTFRVDDQKGGSDTASVTITILNTSAGANTADGGNKSGAGGGCFIVAMSQ